MLRQRKEEMSCNEMARKCIATTQTYFPDCVISLNTEVPDDLCLLTTPLYMERTIRELLFNAAKYSDGQHITLHISQTDTTVRFIVEDVGPGLPEGSEEMLFMPFIKVDDLSEGLGLGLPLSKRHVKSLGGDLILDTSYKGGCRFIVVIPK
jgi:signal transduction histidine kinase